MSKLEVDKVLFAYIAVASHVVSLVLVRVDSGVQRPVYYVSKSLHKAEVRYLPLGKPFWQWYMPCVSSFTISNHTQLLS